MSLTRAFPMNVRGLSPENQELLGKMAAQLDTKRPGIMSRNAYYEGQDRIRQMGIAVPPDLRDVHTVVGWPGMAVGVLEERLDWQGVALPDGDIDGLGLNEIIVDNNLRAETQQAHLESLVGGVSFVVVSAGRTSEGEPPYLVTVEPPTRMTGIWSERLRRLTAACTLDYDSEHGKYTSATLFLPDRTIHMDAPYNGDLRVVEEFPNRLGRVPVVPLVNQPRRSKPWGRSEITPALIGYTDAGVRTILGMEVAREFYSSPQRYIMGADESAFRGSDGESKTAWEAYLGRFLTLSRDEDGEIPAVGQFAAASPAPYIDQIKLLAQMVAGEASIPESYLGFVSANPSSADAIRASEARLVKRAERRQTVFGFAWAEVMRLVLRLRDGEVPPEAQGLVSKWRDPSTPTRAAMADATMKLVSVGVLPPDSEITYEQLGFDQTTIARLSAEKRRVRAERMLDTLTNAAQQTAPTVAAPSDGDEDVNIAAA